MCCGGVNDTDVRSRLFLRKRNSELGTGNFICELLHELHECERINTNFSVSLKIKKYKFCHSERALRGEESQYNFTPAIIRGIRLNSR
jgi:hypothetical protein